MTETDRSSDCEKKIEDLQREIRRARKVQSDLTESEEKYRLVVEHANDAIFIVQNGQVKFPNAKGREIGRQLGIVLEKVQFIEYVHPDDREMVIDRHLRRLQGEDLPNSYNFRLMGSTGEQMWVALNAVLITWEGQPATLNFLRDITAQKELEAHLDQIQKIEALGTLAAGVAHDFNNLLMSIRADAETMRHGSETSDRQRELLGGILHSVASGEAMTQQLLGFARKDTCQFAAIDVNQLLLDTKAIFDRTRHKLEIEADLEKRMWRVAADAKKMERVLLNLFINADQAMPEGGHLKLITRNETIGRSRSQALGLKPGQYGRISVADDGPGMDAATRDRVFEPFFTTKKSGRGTGLGLACSQGIVQSHQGNLLVASQEGVGARFDIFLPVSNEANCRVAAPADESQELVCLPDELDWLRTVLLVDDSQLVIEAMTLMLEKHGLKILNTANPESAVALMKAQRESIDLVILDLIMPTVSGIDVCNRIQEIKPEAPVLLTSGCAADDAFCQLVRNNRVAFIQKPYSERELYQKIIEISR